MTYKPRLEKLVRVHVMIPVSGYRSLVLEARRRSRKTGFRVSVSEVLFEAWRTHSTLHQVVGPPATGALLSERSIPRSFPKLPRPGAAV